MSWPARVVRLTDLPARDVHGLTVREFVGPATARGVSAYTIELPPGAAFPANYHKNAEEVVYVTRGSARTKVGDREYDIEAGFVLYIPAGMLHAIVAGPDGFEAFTLQSPGISEGQDIYFPEREGNP